MFSTFHEHIIRVSHGPQDDLSMDELWSAFLTYAEKPQMFVEHLTDSKIISRTETEKGFKLKRHLFFDKMQIADTVDVISAEHTLVTLVEAGKDFPASSFLIRLEEPETGNLFVRFIYEEEKRNENPMFSEIRKQAYQDKDEFLVRELLQWIMRQRKN